MSDEKVKMSRYAVVDAMWIDRIDELEDAEENLAIDAEGNDDESRYDYARYILRNERRKIYAEQIRDAVRLYPTQGVFSLCGTGVVPMQQEGGGK